MLALLLVLNKQRAAAEAKALPPVKKPRGKKPAKPKDDDGSELF